MIASSWFVRRSCVRLVETVRALMGSSGEVIDTLFGDRDCVWRLRGN